MDKLNLRKLHYTKILINTLNSGDFGTFSKSISAGLLDPNEWLEDYGVTALHLAVGSATEVFAVQATTLLLRIGANPNAVSSDGMTPLHVAAAWGRANVLHLLLMHGGDPWIQDDEHRNAFNHAFEAKAWKVVEMLHQFQLVRAGQKSKSFQLSASPIQVESFIPSHNEWLICDDISKPFANYSEISLNMDQISLSEQEEKPALTSHKVFKVSKPDEIKNEVTNPDHVKKTASKSIVIEPQPVGSNVDLPMCGSPNRTYVVEPAQESNPRQSLFEELVDAVKKRALRLSAVKSIELPPNEDIITRIKTEPKCEDISMIGIDRIQVKKEFPSAEPVTDAIEKLQDNEIEYSSISYASGDGDQSENLQQHLPDRITIEDLSSGNSAYLSLKTMENDSSSISYLSCPEDRPTDNPRADDSGDRLRHRLISFGYEPGPITESTRGVYERQLARIEERGGPPPCRVLSPPQNTYEYENNAAADQQSPAWSSPLSRRTSHFNHGPTSPIFITRFSLLLEETLENVSLVPTYKPLETKLYETFKHVKGCKTSYNYLLLDGRIAEGLSTRAANMSEKEVAKSFMESVFYVGKGKGTRVLSHLTEAREVFYGERENDHPKISTIVEIWQERKGVICLQVFNNISPEEALAREAVIIAALGRRHLTNQKRGEFGGIINDWSQRDKHCLGIYLLFLAKDIFLRDRERAMGPDDF